MPTHLLGLYGRAHWVTETPNPARAIVQHQVGQLRPQTRGLGTFGAWCTEAPILRLDLCRVSKHQALGISTQKGRANKRCFCSRAYGP